MRVTKLAIATSLAVASTMAVAQDRSSPPPPVNPAAGVPVFADDITDRPYTVIGEVHAGVRKATIFSKAASERKIFRELWERAVKLGADAVIKVQYGKSHVTALSWGKTNATGIAIKFTGPAAKPAPADK